MAESGVMAIGSVAEAIAWQADHAEQSGAQGTARVIRALIPVLESDTAVGRRMANWQGLTLEDAMPLRIAGGLHSLHLAGEEDRLGDIYAGLITDQGQVDALVGETVETFDYRLLPWLDRPPQTNVAGRSAMVMAALLWLGEHIAPRFELNEIGASAGINTMMGRFAFDLGGVTTGPSLSSLRIAPDWRGSPPPSKKVEIVGAKGCDVAPIDLTDLAQAERLRAYIWPEASERMARLDTAIAMAERAPPELVRQDAADFVTERLAAEQQDGVTRVLFHTVMWQYLPEATRDAITAAMEAAGANAAPERPLAWIMSETNRETFKQECRVRYWPGGAEWTMLAESHPHGTWVEWLV
ncbi:DUF2332 domain-containing protein [Aurantiacibacter aquimixticola]|uniref:DUF2332 domain-containing protein n=1 Tax=Aurantiacibacter aquimixticola TaxID=1958945 RepID=A0A419RQV6_9SPHN|nr:DUF2332 domain-containing protein [Aurantiacibacter aquimixticola]RJY08178.1 DUF2332 domain-containing protein [Aurantiacibacter aquimixticola]